MMIVSSKNYEDFMKKKRKHKIEYQKQNCSTGRARSSRVPCLKYKKYVRTENKKFNFNFKL